MTTDLMIGMAHHPGTLAAACEALGHAGVNIEGAFGTVTDGPSRVARSRRDSTHATHATRALIDAGFDILAQRQVLAIPGREPAGGRGRAAPPGHRRRREP